MTPDEAKAREAFEKWQSDEDHMEPWQLYRNPENGRYVNSTVQAEWRTWQAARAASPDPLTLAIRFHEAYERLAPSFGYETRKETRAFDPTTPNGKLMVAVCAELFASPDPAPVKGEPVGELVCIKFTDGLHYAWRRDGFWRPTEPGTYRLFTHPAGMAEDAERLRRYEELLYAVERKYPGESRHETALRYIRDRETCKGLDARALTGESNG